MMDDGSSQCLWLIRNLKKILKNKNNFKTFSMKNEKNKIVFYNCGPLLHISHVPWSVCLSLCWAHAWTVRLFRNIFKH